MSAVNRRQNFRVSIPINTAQKVTISGLKGIRVNLNDLSLSGCQLAVHTRMTDIFAANESIEVSITLLDLEDARIRGKIKVVRRYLAKSLILVGVEFSKPDAETLKDLQSVVFKLGRKNRFED